MPDFFVHAFNPEKIKAAGFSLPPGLNLANVLVDDKGFVEAQWDDACSAVSDFAVVAAIEMPGEAAKMGEWRDHWRKVIGDEPPTVKTGNRKELDPSEVLRELCCCLAHRLDQASARNSELLRAQAQLRRYHEQALESMDRIQTFLRSTGIGRTWTASLFPRSSQYLTVQSLLKDGEYVQRIPLRSAGASCIRLFPDPLKVISSGFLSLTLRGVASGEVFGLWECDAEKLASDQLLLQLPRNLGFLHEDLELRMRTQGAVTVPLAYGLRHHDRTYLARYESGSRREIFHRPLALELIHSLPLISEPSIAGAVQAVESARAKVEFLWFDTVEFGEVLGLTMEELAQYSGIFRVTATGELYLHPIKDKPVWMRFRDVIPAGTKRITASVMTRNPHAARVEYFVGALGNDNELADGDIEQGSGWVVVEPNTLTTITAELNGSAEGNLLLGTRIPPGGSMDYAHAHFCKVMFEP